METETADRIMTIEEIEREFDGEWVLVGDPETDEQLEVLSGKVLCHSKDRDEVYDGAAKYRDSSIKTFAWLYNGGIPEGTAVLL